MNKHKPKSAFTIIEVVLVLAIAGLIFLMVFIALPALQRNQRDTQRKNDLIRLRVAIDSYKTNNRGRLLPQVYMMNNFLDNCMRLNGDNFVSPSGEPYELRVNYLGAAANGWAPSKSPYTSARQPWWLHFGVGMKCEGNTKFTAEPNNYTLQIYLEGSGDYCVDG